MNVTAARYVTIALTCFYCGHACADVRIAGEARPTNRALRAAYAGTAEGAAPTWDDHGQPRCPRCRAKLFIERGDSRHVYATV